MKIKVTPEGREGLYEVVDRQSLKDWLVEQGFEHIHNFVKGGAMLIGADHDVTGVLGDIDEAERVAVITVGDNFNANMKHALSLIIDNRLKMYDIGELTLEQLEVVNT